MSFTRSRAKSLSELLTPKAAKERGVVQKATNVGNDNVLTRTFDHMALKVDKLIPWDATELKFHPTRRWQFDRAWTTLKIAVEINGGTSFSAYKMIHTKGGIKRVPSSRHISPQGYKNDLEKVNHAQVLGWKVYSFDAEHVKSGYATKWLADNTPLGGKKEVSEG